MFKKSLRLLRIPAAVLLAAALLLIAIQPAFALNDFLKAWSSHYPDSTSDDAGCLTCHGGSTSTLNAYGKDLCLSSGGSVPVDIAPYLAAVEALDSDLDGTTNLEEISANAQPGWTSGANAVYSASTCLPTGGSISVPAGVPLPYDPPAGGEPVAVPGGPYTGLVNAPVSFDGSASFDSDDGAITSYAWDFGDGATGSGALAEHAYASTGTYAVSLTVIDDEGQSSTNSTSVTITAPSALDLDIAAFKVSSTARTGKAISIQLSVENPGPVLGQAIATVTGVQDGVQVYRWQLNVYDYSSKGSTSFSFPSYTPAAKGTINWTTTISDGDPDNDTAAAATLVK